jgi:hypothetical protein
MINRITNKCHPFAILDFFTHQPLLFVASLYHYGAAPILPNVSMYQEQEGGS